MYDDSRATSASSTIIALLAQRRRRPVEIDDVPQRDAAVADDRIGERSIEENVQEIALAAIRYYQKLLPLATALFADVDLLAHFRLWMQEHQGGPLRIYERVAHYVAAEQRLGRLKPEIDPFSFAALLLGTCHQYVFITYFQGHDPFPVPEGQFVAGIVQTLLHGGTPLK